MALVAFCFLCHLLLLLRLSGDDEQGFLWGDAAYYALAAEAVAAHGTLDLVPRLQPHELEVALAEHQLARGAAGELVIKHSSILPFFGAPFVALIGRRGLLLLNVMFTVGAVAGIAMLLRRFVSAIAALASAYLLGTATLLSVYAYNFSADVAGTCSLALAIPALFHPAPFLGGVLLGTAVALKLSLLPAAAALGAGALWLALAHDAVPRAARVAAAVRLALGGLCGVIPLLALDYHLFGSILVSGYQRIALPDGGTLTHLSDFNQPLLTGLVRILFDGAHGFLSTNPILLIGGFGVLPLLRLAPARRREAGILLAAAACQVLVIGRYDFWDQSHVSNRFLLVLVPLLSPLVALGVEALCRAARAAGDPPP